MADLDQHTLGYALTLSLPLAPKRVGRWDRTNCNRYCPHSHALAYLHTLTPASCRGAAFDVLRFRLRVTFASVLTARTPLPLLRGTRTTGSVRADANHTVICLTACFTVLYTCLPAMQA